MAQVEPLSGAAAQAAEQQQATGGAPSPDEQRACAEQQLSQLGEAVQSLLAARAASAAARSGGGGGAGAGGSGLDSLGSGEWGAEPPEHFLDPILTTLMQARGGVVGSGLAAADGHPARARHLVSPS